MDIGKQKLKELEEQNYLIHLTDRQYRDVIDAAQKDCILKSKIKTIIDSKIAEIIIHEPNTVYERGKVSVLQEIKEKLLKEN